MITKELLTAALDQSVTNYFEHLFTVMMTDTTTPGGLERFNAGLQRLIKAEADVSKIINGLDLPDE
jgi:hypothetical protein